ncbi:MAG TPA: HAD-IIIC family phosphatase [Thermoanaerobaculia bacterium]|jgi:FkbH-like protein|nr:HAD-IIIC family phosphatase [Thermoanaerobaculia bacterium]
MLDATSATEGSRPEAPKPRKPGSVKCLVWDLDNTVWDGILLEDPEVRLRPGVPEALAGLDGRGILHSIASRNDHDLAMAKLKELGLDEYFLYPKVNWGTKSASIAAIAKDLNLAIDALAFVDDQPFEREEVQFTYPQVLCFDALDLPHLLDRPELTPRFVTEDSRLRRRMYQADIARNRAEEAFGGASEEFLATLGMTFTIAPCREEDLKRAEELTVRTHQLNTTGYTYSYEELDALRQSDRHLLLVCSLTDKYGSYGKIGLTLVEQDPEAWTVKLLLMSCRVMSKGVGTILINHLLALAKGAGARLRAEFVSNDRNRAMLVTYKFAGFREVERRGEVAVLENDLTRIQPPPPYVDLRLS